jgi:hypothetical protein
MVRSVVVLSALACITGCSSGVPPAPAREGVTAMQAPEPVTTEEARDLIGAANLEITDLRDMRLHARDEPTAEAIGRQIAAIAGWRDALAGDMAAAPGALPDRQVRSDLSNLERAMQTGASTTPSPPPTRRLPPIPPYEVQELYPPTR